MYSIMAIVVATLVSGVIMLVPKIMNNNVHQTKFIIQEVKHCDISGYCEAMITTGRIGIVIPVDSTSFHVGDTLILTKK